MKRTPTQNKAIHVYYKLLAEALAAGGFTVRQLLEEMPHMDIPPNEFIIKEMWRKIQIAATGKKSTTELDTKEISMIYEIINMNVAEKRGISIAFPEYEEKKFPKEKLSAKQP